MRSVRRAEILSKLEMSTHTFKGNLDKVRDRVDITVVLDKDLCEYRLEVADYRGEIAVDVVRTVRMACLLEDTEQI